MIINPAPEQYLKASELKTTLATAVSNLKDQATALRATVDDGATEGALRAALEKVNLASECLSKQGLDYTAIHAKVVAEDKAKHKTAETKEQEEALKNQSRKGLAPGEAYQTRGTSIHRDEPSST